jgi:hypothetical protein
VYWIWWEAPFRNYLPWWQNRSWRPDSWDWRSSIFSLILIPGKNILIRVSQMVWADPSYTRFKTSLLQVVLSSHPDYSHMFLRNRYEKTWANTYIYLRISSCFNARPVDTYGNLISRWSTGTMRTRSAVHCRKLQKASWCPPDTHKTNTHEEKSTNTTLRIKTRTFEKPNYYRTLKETNVNILKILKVTVGERWSRGGALLWGRETKK